MDIRYTQNFLHNPQLVKHIVDLAQLADIVLEIGPGEGIITRELVKRVKHVVAVELDAKLAQQLRDIPGVQVVQGDILQYDLTNLSAGYSVFSNVPFNITSDLLEYILNPQTGPQ
ncbi:MAG: 16S rRNA (adenine(1518)-N(6)/adenine(1519)-N(6))-dimethyltransferase RsmA, partial [Phototrophicales bacterium]